MVKIFNTFLFFLFATSGAYAGSQPTVKVVTDAWAPYVNSQSEPLGLASLRIKMIAAELNWQLEMQYLPYDQSTRLVRLDKADLAFPFFKTEDRQKAFLFSEPILQVSNRIYYNRQFRSEPALENLPKLRLGKVSGYSYGEKVDALIEGAHIYPNELTALKALFDNQADVIPMTEGVMQQTLQQYFPERLFLIKPISGVNEVSTLHIIGKKSESGREMIAQINQVIAELRDDNIVSFTRNEGTQFTNSLDLARLMSAEGYPIILAQDARSGEVQYFTLPNGTHAAVIEWGPRIALPSSNDRLYKNMMDLTKVVILNGPHLGKELYVKNLYIELD